MSDVHNSLRLGDLLVEKGLITRPQLRQAIEIQQALQTQRFGGKNINGRTELGEILIELGFISRHQLQSNLNWQRRLKATTAVMVFIAPLLTAACGGGAGGSSGSNTTSNLKTEVASSQASMAAPVTNPPSGNDSSANAGATLSDVSPAPFPATSSAPKVSSSSSTQSKVSSSSSKAISSAASSKASSLSSSKISSASSSKISSISSKSSAKSSSSISSSPSSKSIADGPVQLYWNVPTQRENGEYLDITEIGGYELRYRLKTDSDYKTIRISDGFLDAYYFNYLKGDYQFQIATYDKDGLYSDFIDIDPS